MLLTAIASAALAMSVPPAANQITYITRAYYAATTNDHDLELNPYQWGAVVGTIPADENAADPYSTRDRMGGQDAPEWIIVRHRDGLFAIDPFVALPEPTAQTAFQLFKPMKYGTSGPVVTLDTDRSQFSRRRIERTEELFKVLEFQRIQWLKANGYAGPRTVAGNPGTAQTSAGPRTRPEDQPRTRPVESVRADHAPAPRAIILSGDEPVRISLPDLGVSGAVRARVAARGNVLNAPAPEPETAVATNDAAQTEPEAVDQ
jgi:hypothetical protein